MNEMNKKRTFSAVLSRLVCPETNAGYAKRVLLGAMLLTIAVPSAWGQSLSGKLAGVESGLLVIRLTDVDLPQAQALDTVALDSEGRFSYNLKVNTTTRATVSPLMKEVAGQERRSIPYISIVLVPGEQLTLNGTFEDYRKGGTAFYQEYLKACAPLDSIDALQTAIRKKYAKLREDEAAMDAYLKEWQPLSAAYKQTVLNYIKEHPDSDVATAMVTHLGMRNYDEGLVLLTPRAREGKLSPLYKTGQKIMQEEKAKEQRVKEMAGKPAPAFNLPGLDGELVSLESLRGKYVVVDFWGSWCGWCIKGIPDMKKAYEKHKAKVEFVSVDCNDTENKWKKAVATHSMPWIQVRCDGGCNLPEQYNVLGYPTKVVIDPQGNVVKSIAGESPEFYELLDKLFAE